MLPLERAAVALMLVVGVPACRQGATQTGSKPDSSAQAKSVTLGVVGRATRPAQLLAPGVKAPDFTGLAHTGARAQLYALLEKPVLLLFYAENGSQPSEELFKRLSERWLELQPALSLVLAIAPHDSVQLAAYATAAQWPFLFLADQDLAIRLAYGVAARGPGVAAVLVGKNREVLYSHPNLAQEPKPIERLLSACRP